MGHRKTAVWLMFVGVTMLILSLGFMSMTVLAADDVECAPAQTAATPNIQTLTVRLPETSASSEMPTYSTDQVCWAMESDQWALYSELAQESKSLISEKAEEYGVDEALVLAICYNESRFISDATGQNTNETTDWGIMQVNDVCFSFLEKAIGLTDMSELLDMGRGLDAGCALLKHYQEQGYAKDDILLAYQEGEGSLRQIRRGEKVPQQAFYDVCNGRLIYDICL